MGLSRSTRGSIRETLGTGVGRTRSAVFVVPLADLVVERRSRMEAVLENAGFGFLSLVFALPTLAETREELGEVLLR